LSIQPTGRKKLVSRWCSRRFISSRLASTGVASSTRTAVTNSDHTDSGMRNIVMPGQRSLMIVAR
jgi:hypothetical protein